jgi:RNA polymerase sigma-70 factor (ECF subfamily)
MSGDDLKEKDVQAAVTHLKPLPEPTPTPPPEVLEVLFREHYDQIFRTAYRITGSPVDAEDVLQTVFLRLLRREGELDLQPNPAGYLLRASINASLDIMRSRTRSKSVGLDDVATEQLESTFASPETEQQDREMRRLIQEAISKLGTKAAEMFVLRYYEGYGNREIAEMLGTSQMVVGVMLHRSRTRLRKEIGEYLEKHHEA